MFVPLFLLAQFILLFFFLFPLLTTYGFTLQFVLFISAFSSAKADSVSETFHGYSDPVIEEYRLLALISKGGHSLKRVQNRMEILAYYVNDFSNQTKPSGIQPI